MAPFLSAGSTFCIRIHAYGHSFDPQTQQSMIQHFAFLPVQSRLSLTAPDHRFWLLFDYGDEERSVGQAAQPQPRRVLFCRQVATGSRFVHRYSLKTRPFIGPTSMPADLSFLFANQALASPSSLVYDPFVGTGSLLIACAHFGAAVIGADIDWKTLHGLTKGARADRQGGGDSKEEAERSEDGKRAASREEQRCPIMNNFRHYGLRRPELLCSDQSLPVWEREAVFDAIVSDPPYGVRAGARRSGRKEGAEVRPVSDEWRQSHIPASQQYDVEDAVDDLLDMAAKTLRLRGRLVYLLPTTTDFTEAELPRHPCLRLVCCSEQVVRMHFSRRLLTMEKHRAWSPQLNISRRDRLTQPPPKYANIKAAIVQARAAAAARGETEELQQEDASVAITDVGENGERDGQRRSKRQQRRHERFIRKTEHRQLVRQHGPLSFPPSAFLFFNGRIYCSPSSLSSPSSWLVVDDGRVAAVGSSQPPMFAFAASGRHRNLNGRVVLPGLIDSHIHCFFTGKLMQTINFTDCDSIASFQSTIAQYCAQRPPPVAASSSSSASPAPHWYIGNRWEHDKLGRYPTAADIDAVQSAHPVFCWRVCYHVAVVNSAALRLAGIGRGTAAPAGGSIDTGPDGEPTGLLRETAAEMVQRLIVESEQTRRQYVEAGLRRCLEMGLTCVQTNDEGCWPIYRQLVDAEQLPIRVQLTIQHTEMQQAGQPVAGETYGSLLSCHRIKLFADGSLGAETAALSQPYVHRCAHGQQHSSHGAEEQQEEGKEAAGNVGIAIHSQAALSAAVRRAHSLGFRIEVHVIGDRAAAMAVQSVIDAAVPPSSRPVLTHCQVLSAPLLSAFRSHGVVANIQPQFVTADCRWIAERLPPALLSHAYVWRSMLDAGIHCAGGSDSPIEEPSPLLGMHAAIFRPQRQYADMTRDRHSWDSLQAACSTSTKAEREQRLRDWYGGSWRAEQCLDVQQALQLYSTGGAYCGGTETELGELRDGHWADFVLLDSDVIADPHLLLFAKVEEVWVAGLRRK